MSELAGVHAFTTVLILFYLEDLLRYENIQFDSCLIVVMPCKSCRQPTSIIELSSLLDLRKCHKAILYAIGQVIGVLYLSFLLFFHLILSIIF